MATAVHSTPASASPTSSAPASAPVPIPVPASATSSSTSSHPMNAYQSHGLWPGPSSTANYSSSVPASSFLQRSFQPAPSNCRTYGFHNAPVPPVAPDTTADTTASSSSSSAAPFSSDPRDTRFQLSDFARIRTLGTGTFARVCLVRRSHPRDDAEARQVFALKMLRKAAVVKLKQIDHVRHERRILHDVALSGGHPFVTTLQASFADADFLYLLLDYIPGGELFSYLRKFRRFDEPTARFYAAEIVLVLAYLHEQQGGVAYRDLKPENLLLDAAGHVKLVDFGFAKRLGCQDATAASNGAAATDTAAAAAAATLPDTDAASLETYTLCGTPEYIAPEVIQNMGHTTAVDWWALGILIYEFLTGYPPFWHQNPLEIYRQILEKPVMFPQDPPISPAAQDIVRQLCTVDRSRRLGNMSGGAADVRAHPFFAGIDWDALYARHERGPIVPPVRYVGDAQCFDIYPETDAESEPYTAEMAAKYDGYFTDF